MADIVLKIEVNPDMEVENINEVINNNAEISNSSFSLNQNNVFDVTETQSSGMEMLSWGESGELSFNEFGFLSSNGISSGGLVDENNPEMFVWGIVPPSGEYLVEITLTGTSNLKDIVFYGDSVANQFPIEAIIDGEKIIYNDDYRWAISFETQSNTHTIEFTRWNRPNYNACLTFITVMMRYFEINKKNGLKSIESLSQATGQSKEIFYGAISSSGYLEIIDIDGEIADMITDGIISDSNLNIEIFVNNKKVQHHISNNNDYSKGKTFSVQLSNSLNNLDKLTYRGFKNEDISKTLYDILIDALKSIGYTDINYIENTMLGEENTNYLKSIIYPSPYMPVMNFKEFIDKICEIAQLSLTQNDNGDLVFINLKHMQNLNNYIIIPQKMQKSQPFKTIITNNKVERVEYINTNFKKDIDKTVNTYINNQTFIEPAPAPYIVPITDCDYYFFSFESAGQILSQGVRVETFVTNGTFEIIDQSIKDIDSFDFSVSGKLFNKPYFFEGYKEDFWKDEKNSLLQSVIFDDEYLGTGPIGFSEKLTDVSINFKKLEDFSDSTLQLSHSNSINFTKITDGKWKVDYSILTSTAKYYWYGTNEYANEKSGEFKSVDKLTISANGTKWVLEFVDNVLEVGDKSSPFSKSLNRNELLQDNVTYKDIPMGDVIANNILETYNKGLSSAEISVVCGDYYNNDGVLAKNWGNGDIFQIGDIVRIDKDNFGNSLWKYSNGNEMFFRVVGRNFRYVGVPLIDLELQEIKLIQ